VTNLEVFGHMDTVGAKMNIISIFKNGGAPVLLWGCFAVARSGNLDCMKDIMHSLNYQAIFFF